MREIYLDNAATTRVLPEVAERMKQIYLEEYGNPSSLHHKGVEAERALVGAREIIAGTLKVAPRTITFTSCGSESDNLAILGAVRANRRRGRHLVTTNIEHPGVSQAMRYLEEEGFEITWLPVDNKGRVTPEQVAEAVREDTLLVSVMHVNNEIGAIEPVEAIGAAVKEKNPATLFHVDAVQSYTKLPLLPRRMHIDLLAISGHKIHAPKGIAALYVAETAKIQPVLFGGGQQAGLRSGTENVAGAAGMALAAERLFRTAEEDREALYDKKQAFLDAIREIPDVRVNGLAPESDGSFLRAEIEKTAPHIISISVKGVRAEVLLHALEDRGVYVSSGSACSTHHRETKGTVDAIGVPAEYREGTIRLSLSVFTTEEEIREGAAALRELIPELRRFVRR